MLIHVYLTGCIIRNVPVVFLPFLVDTYDTLPLIMSR